MFIVLNIGNRLINDCSVWYTPSWGETLARGVGGWEVKEF